MPVKRSIAACLLVAGCGPQVDVPSDWMIGVFSTRLPGRDDFAMVHRYYFEEGGAVRRELLASCSMITSATAELSWTAVGEDRVRIELDPEEWNGTEAFILERLDGCDEYRMYWQRPGVEPVGEPVYRAEICMRTDFCPDGSGEIIDCGCVLEYCDGEPPPPLECAEP